MTAISFPRTTANIAAWNLNGFNGITAKRIRRQVEGLAMLDAEVIALVEINPVSVMDKFVEGLSQKGVEYEYTMPEQESKLKLGVLYKKGIEAKNASLIEGSDLGDSKKRKAFSVELKVGKFDFTLVLVHLKSGRSKKDQKTRDKQAKVIADHIKSLRSHDRKDIILTGDFNMIPGQDVSNFHFLGGDDMLDFISCWDLQERYSHILDKGRANLLDGFAISRTYSSEYIKGSLRLYQMHWTMNRGREAFKDEVSDHLPFVATFRIDRDRD